MYGKTHIGNYTVVSYDKKTPRVHPSTLETIDKLTDNQKEDYDIHRDIRINGRKIPVVADETVLPGLIALPRTTWVTLFRQTEGSVKYDVTVHVKQ